MTRRVPAAAAIVALSLFVFGCDNGESSADPATTSATTAPTTPSSTAAVTTQPPNTSAATPTASTTAAATPTSAAVPSSTAPPGPEDWVAIAQNLENVRHSLYQAPDLARIPGLCSPQSDCANLMNAQLSDMISQGARVVDDAPYDVVAATVVEGSSPGGKPIAESFTVAIDVTVRVPPAGGRVVDAAGNTLYLLEYNPPPGETYTSRWNLTRFSLTDPWRLFLREDG